MENYKKYLNNLLTELITKYVELEWDMYFCTWYINDKWHYVTLQERTDSTWLDYSIRDTMLDSEYWNEYEIEWWEIIFQFNDDYYWIDIDELKYYKETLAEAIKFKDKDLRKKTSQSINDILTMFNYKNLDDMIKKLS